MVWIVEVILLFVLHQSTPLEHLLDRSSTSTSLSSLLSPVSLKKSDVGVQTEKTHKRPRRIRGRSGAGVVLF